MHIETIKQNLSKSILLFAFPSIIAMILTSAISIIDGYFTANYIGKSAISAVNLGLPILYTFLAVGIMIGGGGASMAIRLLGRKRVEKSIAVFNQTLCTQLLLLIVLSLLFWGFLHSIVDIFDVTVSVKAYFMSYYQLMLIAYPIMMLNVNLGMFIRAEGRPAFFMIYSIIMVVMNIILDYLFVTQFGLGISGIALASVVSILIGLIYLLSFFIYRSQLLIFRRFTFSFNTFVASLKNGVSEFIGQISMCITSMVLNIIILREGGIDGIAAFTLASYLAYLFTMIVLGFCQGAAPLMGFTNGAKEHQLEIKIRNRTMGYVSILGVLIVTILFLSPQSYGQMFIKNSEVNSMLDSGILLYTSAFLFLGINMMTSFYFTSIGNAKVSAIISIARGFVILLSCILIFPALWGMNGVWLISPVTEFLTMLLSLWFMMRQDKRYLRLYASQG